MTYSINYSGKLKEHKIDATLKVESISITGALANFLNKMRDQHEGLTLSKVCITDETKEENENTH